MNKLITILCSLALLLNSTVAFAENAAESTPTGEIIEIHVSPSGSDSNSGTKDKPLKTMNGAKKKVKSVKGEDKTVKVIFHEGDYRVSTTTNFTAEDNGYEGNPIIYMAAEGEKPVFKGSIELDTSKFTDIEDQNVLDILPDESVDKVAQLDLKSHGILSMGNLPQVNYGAIVVEYNDLFLDGEIQTLSRWPNTGYANIGKVVDANTAVFEMRESNAARWGNSPNMRFHGFTRWDWSFERAGIVSIDQETRQIKLDNRTIFDKKMTLANGRYYIVNILEELDEPGEWYVDEEKMILYYYPVYPVNNAVLEMSVLDVPIVTFKGASNIVFDGLSFEQTRGDAIQLDSCKDIVLTNNTYKNIGRIAISNNNDVNKLNSDIEISNSEFYSIGNHGVFLVGGNYDTLEGSDIVIKNNHFSRCGQKKRSYAGAVNVQGVGFTIENNLMEDMPHAAIQCNGSLHQINYNEIFNVCQDSNDMGAIYAGRNVTWRGTEVKYNYIHDIVPAEGLAGQIMGIYWDDALSGNIMKYNIFENIPRAIMVNAGSDHLSENNIFVDCPEAMRFAYTDNLTTNLNLFQDAIAKAEEFPIYYEKFPEMKTIDLEWTRSHNNRALNNYLVNSYGNAVDDTNKEMWTGENLLRQNLSKGNVLASNDYSQFVDPENGNYEIKPDAEILKTLPELGKIKMADIGIQGKEQDENDGEFIKIYPKNGQTKISTSGFYLKWQPSEYYTEYIVKVAKDPEFKNIVFEERTIRNYALCDALESGGKVYYWNVTGIAGGVTNDLSEKTAYGAPYSFRTPNNEKLDQIILTESIGTAEKLYNSLTPGSEPGQCEQQYLTWYSGIIRKAKNTNKLMYGDQGKIDEMNEELQEATAKMASYVYKGHVTIDDMLADTENWSMIGDQKIENGTLTVSGGHALYSEYVKTYNIYKFRVKIDNFQHMFVIAYKANGGGDPWVPGSLNYSFYLKNDIFEFQRYVGGTGGIIETKENDGLLKEGEWAEVAVGAMDVPGGIQVYVTINGQEIFNYFDDTGAIVKDGYMQFSSYGPVTAQVQAVEELGVFDSSIVMGGTVEYKDPVDFDNSLLTAENIRQQNGTVTDVNGEIELRAKDADHMFSYRNPVDANNIYTFDAKVNTEGNGQSIAILGTDALNEYRVNIKANTIELVRNFDGKQQTLFIGNNKYIKNGQFANIKIGSCNNEYGTRVFLHIDGQKVFDCTDMYNKIKIGGLKFYDNNRKGMVIR